MAICQKGMSTSSRIRKHLERHDRFIKLRSHKGDTRREVTQKRLKEMSDTFSKITEASETLNHLAEEPSDISDTVLSYVEAQNWTALTYLKNVTIRSWAIYNIIEGELAERRYGLTKQKDTFWFGPPTMRWKDVFVFRSSYMMPDYDGDRTLVNGGGNVPNFYKPIDRGDQIAIKENNSLDPKFYSTEELVGQATRTTDATLRAFKGRLEVHAMIQEEVAKYIAEEAWQSFGSGNDFSGFYLNIQKLKAGHNEVITGLPPSYTEPPPDYVQSYLLEKQQREDD